MAKSRPSALSSSAPGKPDPAKAGPGVPAAAKTPDVIGYDDLGAAAADIVKDIRDRAAEIFGKDFDVPIIEGEVDTEVINSVDGRWLLPDDVDGEKSLRLKLRFRFVPKPEKT